MSNKAIFFVAILSIGFNFFYFLLWNWMVTDKTVWFVLSGMVRNFPSGLVSVLPFFMPGIFHLISGILLFSRAKVGLPIAILLLIFIFAIDLVFAKFLYTVNGISEFSILFSRLIFDVVFVVAVILLFNKSSDTVRG